MGHICAAQLGVVALHSTLLRLTSGLCGWAGQVVRELLRVGPCLNAIDADGNGALHLAAQDGHADIVALLKDAGIVDGLPNLGGFSPADLARANGHAAIARSLAEDATRKVRSANSGARLDLDALVVLTVRLLQEPNLVFMWVSPISHAGALTQQDKQVWTVSGV